MAETEISNSLFFTKELGLHQGVLNSYKKSINAATSKLAFAFVDFLLCMAE